MTLNCSLIILINKHTSFFPSYLSFYRLSQKNLNHSRVEAIEDGNIVSAWRILQGSSDSDIPMLFYDRYGNYFINIKTNWGRTCTTLPIWRVGGRRFMPKNMLGNRGNTVWKSLSYFWLPTLSPITLFFKNSYFFLYFQETYLLFFWGGGGFFA